VVEAVPALSPRHAPTPPRDLAGGVVRTAEKANELRDAVRSSLRNARQAASGARLPRAMFKTTLRAAQALPPLKRAMFAGMGG
jgi:hypothetical protein